MSQLITLKSYKYPNKPHYEWQGELIEATSDYVIVRCSYGRKLIHHTKGKTFAINNTSIEFFSLKEWFTAAMEIDDGEIVSYYCNIAMPSTFENQEVHFIDLDLDLIKKRGMDWELVDEEEYEENRMKYGYSEAMQHGALKGVEELKQKIANKEFPFNPEFLKSINRI